MPEQALLDLAEPVVELFGAAAIHGRERTDHPVAAGGDHKLDTGDQKHWRCDQRQAEAVAKARQEIGGWQGFSSRLRCGVVVLASLPTLARMNAKDKDMTGRK